MQRLTIFFAGISILAFWEQDDDNNIMVPAANIKFGYWRVYLTLFDFFKTWLRVKRIDGEVLYCTIR